MVRETEIRRSAVVDEVEEAASTWGISRADYSRYRELMRGRRGVWSPEADPLLVLGAHARSAEERRRLAEAFVMAEHRRVEGELAFEREIQAAWARLFPGRRRVELGGSAGPPATRYAVLVGRSCRSCGSLVARYAARREPVDFHVAGASGDADLRAWVDEQAFDAGQIGIRITVSHSSAAFPGEGPSVYGLVDGRWFEVE